MSRGSAPQTSDFWTAEGLREATGGRWLDASAADDRPVAGVSTDTRQLRPGEAYVALRGERFDGHAFLPDAAAASVLVIDRPSETERLGPDRPPVLVVDDTLAALGAMASAYRARLSAWVIAVTGSVGKTTTKELIHAALSARYPGRSAAKSHNNRVGVPMTLLSARPSDAYVVVEVGTDTPVRMRSLGDIVQPDVAVITYAGHAHLAGLGSVEEVAREKASLLETVRPGGSAVINGEVDALRPYHAVVPSVIYGEADGRGLDIRLTHVEQSDGLHFEVDGTSRFTLPMLGVHNAKNALAAIAVARRLGLSDREIAAGLADVREPSMRLEVTRIGPGHRGVTVINDAYNANPESMAAALSTLEATATEGRRIAILGDMADLGDHAADLHRDLGEKVSASRLDGVAFVGSLSEHAAEVVRTSRPEMLLGHRCECTADLTHWVRPGDTVLLKASRAVGLERLLSSLADYFGSEAETATP